MKHSTLLYATTVALATASFAFEAMAAPADGDAFVAKFRHAVAQPGGAALAELTQLPFLFEGRAHQRDAFVAKVVPALFTPKVRECLQRAQPRVEEGRLVLWCGPYAFYLGPVQGRWRLVEFGVDAEG